MHHFQWSYTSKFRCRISYLEKYSNELEKIYRKLEDGLSKKVYLAFIKAKLFGDSDELFALNVNNEDQYFLDFIQIKENEVFVDCGDYDGDTITNFVQHTKGKFDKIYAFECDEKNMRKLQYNTIQYNTIHYRQTKFF
jgi:hypothetical protein